MTIANQQTCGQRIAEKRRVVGLTQRQLADALEVSLTSIQNYEAGRIPNGDILIRLAGALRCSAEWLVTGEGEREKSSSLFVGPATARRLMEGGDASAELAAKLRAGVAQQRPDAAHYNGNDRRALSIGDLLAKTAKVLESDTVYRDALYSNIEAFYHGVTLEQKINDMEASISKRLDAVEAENRQLRQDLEHERAQSAVRDTG